MVTGSYDKTARLWNADSGKALHILEGHDDLISSVQFSPDGNTLLTISKDRLRGCGMSIRAGVCMSSEVMSGLLRAPCSVKTVHDSLRPMTPQHDYGMWLGRALHVLEGHKESVDYVQFSPNGRRLLTASRDKSARLWDVVTGKVIQVFTGHNGSYAVQLSPDGKRVVTAPTIRPHDCGIRSRVSNCRS